MNLLTKCKEAFEDGRKSVFEGIAILWKISEERLWEGSYSSMGEYVEQELRLHPTQASRWLKAYEHYVIQGKVEFSKLKSTNPEKLYLAIKLPMPPEEQVVRAQSWNMAEIKEELAEKNGPHDHQPKDEARYAICACGKFFKVI